MDISILLHICKKNRYKAANREKLAMMILALEIEKVFDMLWIFLFALLDG